MTTAQVVETSVTNNSLSQNYSHPDDHTRQTTDTPGFKPFTNSLFEDYSQPDDTLDKQLILLGSNHFTIGSVTKPPSTFVSQIMFFCFFSKHGLDGRNTRFQCKASKKLFSKTTSRQTGYSLWDVSQSSDIKRTDWHYSVLTCKNIKAPLLFLLLYCVISRIWSLNIGPLTWNTSGDRRNI